MKTLLILLMPIFIVAAFGASSRFFAEADYYRSAMCTLAWLGSITLWITALSSKKHELL